MITKQQTTLYTLLRQLPLPAIITLIALLFCTSLLAQSTQPAGGSSAAATAESDDANVSEEEVQAIAEHARGMQQVMEQQEAVPPNNQPQAGRLFDQTQSVTPTPASTAQPVTPVKSTTTSVLPTDRTRSDTGNRTSKQSVAKANEPIAEPTHEELKPDVTDGENPGASQVKATTINLVPGRQPWEYYKPLVERNIFTRTQPRSAGDRDRSQTTERPVSTTPVAPKSSWVLTGIVIHAEGNYAFFENSLTNVTLRITAGQDLGDSRVTSIAADHVIATHGENDLTVAIGSTIDGSSATLGAARSGSVFGETTPPTEGAGTPAASSTSTPADDPSKMSIIERMRARRLQESSK